MNAVFEVRSLTKVGHRNKADKRNSRSLILPRRWVEYHEKRLNRDLEEVEIYYDGDDLVLKCPAA